MSIELREVEERALGLVHEEGFMDLGELVDRIADGNHALNRALAKVAKMEDAGLVRIHEDGTVTLTSDGRAELLF